MSDDSPDLAEYWKEIRVPPAPKEYHGVRDKNNTAHVFIVRGQAKRRKLPSALRVVRHSPTGFEWGYDGSGPAQLAIAILIDAFPDKGKDWAVKYQRHPKSCPPD
jgi:hypothetical protein